MQWLYLCCAVTGSPAVLKTLTSLTPGSTVLKTSGGMTTILSAGNLVKKIQTVQPKVAQGMSSKYSSLDLNGRTCFTHSV